MVTRSTPAKPRIFYGWFVVAGTFAVTFVGFGCAYSFSAFVVSLLQDFAASRGSVSIVFSLAGFFYFGLGVVSGPLADYWGARRLAVIGMVLTGLGLVVASVARSLPQVYAAYGLGVGLGARKIAEEMITRAAKIGHVGTTVYAHFHFALLEMMRRDRAAAGRHGETLVKLARAHEIPMFAAFGAVLASWSRVQSVDHEIGLADMRAAIAACRKQGIGLNVPAYATALAEAEAEAGEIDAALATVDGAIAEIERTGQRWCEAEAHRIRGEILLKRDPAKTAPAEDAFLTAIAVAQQQKAKSFELRAALSLAKLYQSTNRAADAHAVLAPALEGFSPTPEMPEIEEAQALMAEL